MFRPWQKRATVLAVLVGLAGSQVLAAPASADGNPMHRAGAAQAHVTGASAVRSPAPPPVAIRPFVIVRGDDHRRFELSPASDQGGFDATDLAVAQEAFSYRNDQSTHEVEPRVLDLAYRAMLHFNAPHVVLVSGFRRTRVTSRHSHGRAIDMHLPDVSVRELASWLEQSGFVGVGIYPRSGFVHLDVRGSSYFWVDNSGSGRRGRARPRRMESAAHYDQLARERGETPDPEVVSAEEAEETIAETRQAARRHHGRHAARRHGVRHHRRPRARAARAPHSG
ncbi:MAG: DUF882 domain-containing protein [Sandaracinaceae bacterium]|jgi:hypothetical protein|nr:DUF882 domain-containing protein [Sandaracinaceae bacterium]